MPGGESAKKLFAKNQPSEAFRWRDYTDPSLANDPLALQQCSQGHGFVSEREGVLTSCRDDGGGKRDFDNNCGFSVKRELRKTCSSRSIKSEAVLDGSLNDLHFMDVVKGNDSLEGSVSHSECSHLPFKTENSDYKKSVNQRHLRAEMESYSRTPSKSNSAQSLTGHENSLGKTLATSLKLIAANSATSPLTHSPVHSDGESFHAETMSYTSNSNASDRVTPVVVLSPAEPPDQSDNTPVRKYSTRASLKKEKLSKRKSSDFEMMKPILSKDGSVTLYQCEKCSKVFNKKQTLRQHFITHTDRFACSYCDTRCKSKGDLHRHIQTHTKEKPYHCDVCNTDCTRETILRKHMKTQLHLRACYERENIARLHKMIDKEKNADKFVTTQTQVKLGGLSCSQCCKVSFSRGEYKKHMKSHTFKYVCGTCQKGCKTALLLKIHSRSHNRSSSLFCKVCSRSFISLHYLKEHRKSHKFGTSNRAVEEHFIKAAISKHNKVVARMPKKCPSVDDSKEEADSQSSLSKLKKLECDECHKTFTSEKRLANHSRVHNGTYICGICSKAFSTLSKLKIHLKFHGKILKCDVCDANFYDDKELEGHVQEQHGGSDFTCKLCYEQFENGPDLNNHMRDHAPTMLFSGKSLDETALPLGNKGKKKPARSGIDILEFSDSEEFSDIEDVQNQIRPRKVEPLKLCASAENSVFDSQEFLEIIKSVVEDSDDNANDSDVSDSDDELFSDIVATLRDEDFSSGDSDDGSKNAFLYKPLLHEEEDIIKKYYAEFERHSEKDEKKQLFKCRLCSMAFDEDKYLKNHLRCHFCEYCNKFFVGKDKLSAHKSRHVRYLLKQIKTEVNRLHTPKQKWKTSLSSESENELEDQFLNELEDILEGEPPKEARSVNFLHSLSHDEIVRANKHIFEQYSCLDLTNNIFACTICKRKYARPTTLTRHFKTHVCQFCNKFFEDKSDLLEHKYKHRKKAALMKAEITGEGSKMPPSPVVSKPNRDMFKRYSFIDSDRNINRCTLCCKDFVRRTVLTRHMKTHICSHCDKFFEDKYDLAKHVTFHQVEKQYMEDDEFTEYDEDDKQYSTNSSVVGNLDHDDKSIAMASSFTSSLRHLNPSFHAQPACASRNGTITFIQIPNSESGETAGSQVFTAPGNGASSFQIISQPVEVYKDAGQESFLVASTSCQGGEPEKIITISQPQIVAGGSEERERLFECGECGKRFFKNGHLRSHMTIHTGDRPCVCRLCGKAFGRGTTLRKHEKTHMKRCKICDTSFSHKYELDLHMEIHRTYAFYK